MACAAFTASRATCERRPASRPSPNRKKQTGSRQRTDGATQDKGVIRGLSTLLSGQRHAAIFRDAHSGTDDSPISSTASKLAEIPLCAAKSVREW